MVQSRHGRRGRILAVFLVLAGLGTLAFAFYHTSRSTPIEAPAVAVAPWFVEVSDEVGLRFMHDAGPGTNYFMPQLMGSGAALFDFDNDGLLDIYLIQNGGPGSPSTNRLFRQGRDGHFTDVSAGSGLDVNGYGMGVAIGDINNDGWPDVFLTEYGRVRLFLNNGDGRTFTDISQEAGLDHLQWATSATFVDLDRDGFLDLVFVSYVDYDPSMPCPGQGGPTRFLPSRSLSRHHAPGLSQPRSAHRPWRSASRNPF